MKTSRVLQVILVVLLIALISLVSFVGIYMKDNAMLKNIVKDFSYGTELSGKRLVQYEVSTAEKEKKKEDTSTGTDTASTEETGETVAPTEGTETTPAETEKEPVNSPDVLVGENYQKSKDIISKRLNQLKIAEYSVGVDNETGRLTVELPENGATDKILQSLSLTGKFEMVDSETKEVLLNNSDIKEAYASYYTQQTGTSVYVSIKFNNAGAKKLEEISNTYKEETENNNTTENTVDNTLAADGSAENILDMANRAAENQTTDTADTTTDASKTTKKQVTLMFNDEEYTTTQFGQTMTTGELQLTIGTPSTDTTTLQEYLQEASMIAMLVNDGNLPIVYTTSQNQYISSTITETQKVIAIVTFIIVIACMITYLIVEYKGKGILLGVSFIGYIATLFLIFKYTDVTITISAIIALIVSIIIDYMFLIKISKKEIDSKMFNNKLFKHLLIIVPAIIIAIVYCFANSLVLSGFGTALFWGIAILGLYNITITKILNNVCKK